MAIAYDPKKETMTLMGEGEISPKSTFSHRAGGKSVFLSTPRHADRGYEIFDHTSDALGYSPTSMIPSDISRPVFEPTLSPTRTFTEVKEPETVFVGKVIKQQEQLKPDTNTRTIRLYIDIEVDPMDVTTHCPNFAGLNVGIHVQDSATNASKSDEGQGCAVDKNNPNFGTW